MCWRYPASVLRWRSLLVPNFNEGHSWIALPLERFSDLDPFTLEMAKKVRNKILFDMETRDGLVSRWQQNNSFRSHKTLRFRS